MRTVNLVGFSHEESSEQTRFCTCLRMCFFPLGTVQKVALLLFSFTVAYRNTKFSPTDTLII